MSRSCTIGMRVVMRASRAGRAHMKRWAWKGERVCGNERLLEKERKSERVHEMERLLKK